MTFIDTNIFLRYLARPATPLDEQKYQACARLFQRVQAGEEEITTTEAVIAEVVYVLTSPRQYGLSADDSAARLRPILTLRRFTLPHKRAYLRALDLFATTRGLDFEDALVVAHLERQRLTDLYSYDTDFDQFSTVVRLEP
jgi:predicted nucleic acid-binding protein